MVTPMQTLLRSSEPAAYLEKFDSAPFVSRTAWGFPFAPRDLRHLTRTDSKNWRLRTRTVQIWTPTDVFEDASRSEQVVIAHRVFRVACFGRGLAGGACCADCPFFEPLP